MKTRRRAPGRHPRRRSSRSRRSTSQLLDAHGCMLAEDVARRGDLPPFDNSAMDGYAVRVGRRGRRVRSDPGELPVVGDIAAGSQAAYTRAARADACAS